MTLSRIRRAQLPHHLPAECISRQRLLLRTRTAGAPQLHHSHARHYAVYSVNYQQIHSLTSKGNCDSKLDNGTVLSSPFALRHNAIPRLPHNPHQTRFATATTTTTKPLRDTKLPAFYDEDVVAALEISREDDPFADLNNKGVDPGSRRALLGGRQTDGDVDPFDSEDGDLGYLDGMANFSDKFGTIDGSQALLDALQYYSEKGKIKAWVYKKVQALQRGGAWMGRGNQTTKTWKIHVLKKQLMKEIELIEHNRLLDKSEERKRQFGLMLGNYFPNTKEQTEPFVPLPQYERNGAGVDDIYLYQLLWKATGQVNEAKRKIKASARIYERLEKYRRAQLVRTKSLMKASRNQHDLQERIQKRLVRVSQQLAPGRRKLEQEMERREMHHEAERQRVIKFREAQAMHQRILVQGELDGEEVVTTISKVPFKELAEGDNLREGSSIDPRMIGPSTRDQFRISHTILGGKTETRLDDAQTKSLDSSAVSEATLAKGSAEGDDGGSQNAVKSFGDFKKFLGLSNTMEGEKDSNHNSIETLYDMALDIQQRNVKSKGSVTKNASASEVELDDGDPFAELNAQNNEKARPKSVSALSARNSRRSTLTKPTRRLFSTQATARSASATAAATGPESISGEESDIPNAFGDASRNHTSAERKGAPLSLGSLRDRLRDKAKRDPSILNAELPEASSFGRMQDRFISRAQGYTAEAVEDPEESIFASDIQIEDTRDPTGMTGVRRINPGSIAEIEPTRGSRPIFGVVLQKAGATNSQDYFFVLDGGAVMEFSTRRVNYVRANFVSDYLIKEIINATKTTGEVPRNLLVEISNRIQQFAADCKKALLTHADALRRISGKVCLEQATQSLTLDEIAVKVFPKGPTDAQKYAVHAYLLQDKDRFQLDLQFHSTTQRWEIKPKAYLKTIAMVPAWVREQNRYITSFAQKARTIIDIGRKMSKTHPVTCESQALPTRVLMLKNITWSPEDKEILKFLSEATRPRAISAAFAPVFPVILRLVNRSERELLDVIALKAFMRDIGVFSPWDDEALAAGSDHLPGQALNYPIVKSQLNHARFDSYEEDKSGFVDFSNDMKDSMAKLRHDWGDLPVYCIDDKLAEEIDDGISIERVHGSKTEVWVRVHVANPTAFIPIDHELAKMARDKVQSLYASQRSYPMLPKSICMKYFSLAPDRPVLTFSLRMNLGTGKIVDYDIRPGTIHNVKSVTYAQMGRLLNGENKTKGVEGLYLTNRPPDLRDKMIRELEQDAHRNWTQEERDDILLITNALEKNLKLRAEEGLASPNFTTLNVRVDDGKGNKNRRGIGDNPVIRLGMPYIDVFFENRQWSAKRPEFIVVSSMLLASHVAGDWLMKHGIPSPYRGLTRLWENQETGAIWDNSVNHVKTDLGTVIDERLETLYGNETITELSPVPKKHDMLAFKTYVKSTSPLRRYTDMLTHYIIEHELLNQALPEDKRKRHLFDVQAMSDECRYIEPKERYGAIVQASSFRVWKNQLLHDLYRSGKLPVPTVIYVQVISVEEYPKPITGKAVGWPIDRVRVAVPDKECHDSIRPGDIVRCRFSDDQFPINEAMRAIHYNLEYVDTKTTIDETREQLFADLELRKKGELAITKWPALTDADIAEAETIANSFPESMFIQMRRDRANGKHTAAVEAAEAAENSESAQPGYIRENNSDPLFAAIRQIEGKEAHAANLIHTKKMAKAQSAADRAANARPKGKSIAKLQKEARLPGRSGIVGQKRLEKAKR